MTHLRWMGEERPAPAWARDISPFTHVPMAPAVQVAPGPLVALTAVTIALAAAGFVLMRRRDLAA